MNKLKERLLAKRVNSKGFTLVELIIVIAIIAVLAAVIAPQYIKYVDTSKAAADHDTLAAIEQAVNVLCADGTITATTADVVTWNHSTGVITGSNVADVAELVNAKTSGTPVVYTTAHAGYSSASDAVFSVTVTSGTPKVSCSIDYSAWGK